MPSSREETNHGAKQCCWLELTRLERPIRAQCPCTKDPITEGTCSWIHTITRIYELCAHKGVVKQQLTCYSIPFFLLLSLVVDSESAFGLLQIAFLNPSRYKTFENVFNNISISQFRGVWHHMVCVLDLAIVRKALPTSNHHGIWADVHWGVAESRPAHHSQLQDDAVEMLLHFDARLRHHCRQLLPLLDFLSAHHLAADVFQGGFPLWNRKGPPCSPVSKRSYRNGTL